MIVIVNI